VNQQQRFPLGLRTRCPVGEEPHQAHEAAGRAVVHGALLDHPLGLLQGQLHHLDDLVIDSAATGGLVRVGHLAVVHGLLGTR